jgi:hypothetical protein
MRTQIALERGDIEAMRLGDRTRALKVVVVAHALITDARELSIKASGTIAKEPSSPRKLALE